MSTGKYLSLEEARKQSKLKRFIKEHPSKGDKKAFDGLLDRMARNKPTKSKKMNNLLHRKLLYVL